MGGGGGGRGRGQGGVNQDLKVLYNLYIKKGGGRGV